MKKLMLIGGIAIIIVIILLVIGVSNLGPIIKTAVNTYGPKITKTELRLSDVGISIFTGEANLKDFFLGNPKGFKSPHALKVGTIHIDIDEGSLTGDTIVIDKIEVVAPEIIYEKSLRTDNFQALLDNLQSTAPAEKPKEKTTGEDSGGKKIMIRDFFIRDGHVSLAATVLGGKGISVGIPDIHLKDLGKEDEGTSPAEALKEVLAALYQSITSPGVSNALKENIKNLGGGIKAAAEGAKKQIETVGEGVKEQAENVGKDLKDKAKGLFGD